MGAIAVVIVSTVSHTSESVRCACLQDRTHRASCAVRSRDRARCTVCVAALANVGFGKGCCWAVDDTLAFVEIKRFCARGARGDGS